ncbi:MAG TPA: ATP-binding protein, partial [Chroococcidiopsis sp.]
RFLLHAVSHDLRNPVTGMVMVLKNLLNGQGMGCFSTTAIPCAVSSSTAPSPAAPSPTVPPATADAPPAMVSIARPVLERMVESGDRQLKLINSLLEAHTIETQGLELTLVPLQLAEVIASAVSELQPFLGRNQATLTVNLPPDLPLVTGDRHQLWRVLENLITNALKHNPPGLTLSVDVTLEGDRLRCNIRDNGVGIPDDQHQQLFELYRRGINARHTQGLGIGLYLCQQIVWAHHGDIGVDSIPNQGATFWFTLPLAAVTANGLGSTSSPDALVPTVGE